MKSTRAVHTGIALGFIHLVALLAFLPPFFTWSGFWVATLLYFVSGGIGITLCYHRLLTHRSFRVPRPVEYALAIIGVLALQGGPIEWVSTHRKHHAHTDSEGDPHSGYDGLWWTHIEWLYRTNPARLSQAEQDRFAHDLVKDPFYRMLDKSHAFWQIGLGIALFIGGGWSWVIWGIFARLVFTYHATWLVNSIAHASGYQSFRTGDLSTNNWFVALFTWGEGWHNNHHAFPSSARHGLRWYEVDITWMLVRTLQFLRIARDVKVPTPAMMDRLRVDRVLKGKKAVRSTE